MSLTHPALADRTDVARDVRLALLGCGTVGGGVARLLVNPTSTVAARGGIDYWLTGIAVRSLSKPRPQEIPPALFTEDARRLVEDANIDVVNLCINPIAGLSLLQSALAAGIMNVFIQPGAGSADIDQFARAHDMTVHNGCILREM